MLPILISVSLTPGPYWPAAKTSPALRTKHPAARPAQIIRWRLMIVRRLPSLLEREAQILGAFRVSRKPTQGRSVFATERRHSVVHRPLGLSIRRCRLVPDR